MFEPVEHNDKSSNQWGAPHSASVESDPPTAEDHHELITVEAEVKGILDHLPRQTIFAFTGDIAGADSLIWQYGPCVQSSLQILMALRTSMYGSPALYRELEPCRAFFAAPATQALRKHALTDASRTHAVNCLERLTQINGLRFAIAWQVPGDHLCRLHLRGYDLIDAFEHFSDSMAQTVQQQLEA